MYQIESEYIFKTFDNQGFFLFVSVRNASGFLRLQVKCVLISSPLFNRKKSGSSQNILKNVAFGSIIQNLTLYLDRLIFLINTNAG